MKTSEKLREATFLDHNRLGADFNLLIAEIVRLESIEYHADNLAHEVGPGYSGHADTLIEMFEETP